MGRMGHNVFVVYIAAKYVAEYCWYSTSNALTSKGGRILLIIQMTFECCHPHPFGHSYDNSHDIRILSFTSFRPFVWHSNVVIHILLAIRMTRTFPCHTCKFSGNVLLNVSSAMSILCTTIRIDTWKVVHKVQCSTVVSKWWADTVWQHARAIGRYLVFGHAVAIKRYLLWYLRIAIGR